ncbi:hypothetical protein [Salinibacterium sp. M195]|uniref:hypothetical protein n=1 Tax=Salinibacterium sp. M195 TaxID=2583374 RepID=UPI001C63B097|nr:hypothetical protein [Salinibacterium sp. M195]
MLRSIDYSGLIDPMNPQAVSEFRAVRRDHFGYSQFGDTAKLLLVAGVGVLVVLIASVPLSAGIGSILGAAFLGSDLNDAFPLLFIGLALLVIAGSGIYVGVRFVRRNGSPWQRFYRMSRFAEANNLSFAPLETKISYPGLIFGEGGARAIRNRFQSASGRGLDYGNYEYTTGSGKNRRTHNWGYLALQLDRALPHMVLDARANNQLFGISNLPLTFSKNQVLKLEGDFNSHFTLYCPEQYERDALYVFTPDLMALLIDHAAPFDVEVIDKWLLVYSPKPFDLVDPAQHRRLLGIADTVGSKTLRQSRNYADEQIGDPLVNLIAPRGQRLKTRTSTLAIVVFSGGIVAWVAVQFFLDSFN